MRTLPTLQTPRLQLRPFRLTDAGDVQRLAGDAAVAATTLTIPHPYGDGMAETWIATHADQCAAGTNIVLAITEPGSGLVGAINLRLEPAHQRGELGYWIGLPFWGRGYATEAVMAMLRLGFGDLGLNRIMARHLPRNPASGRVMRKAGMRHEGIQRQHVLKGEVFEDLECYAILREEFRSASPDWP